MMLNGFEVEKQERTMVTLFLVSLEIMKVPICIEIDSYYFNSQIVNKREFILTAAAFIGYLFKRH